jgi:hypothetical protein
MPTTTAGRRPDPAVRSRWQQRLLAFERSGLSATAFCARERLSLPSFYSWRRRLRNQTPPAAANQAAAEVPFLPVQVLPAAAAVEAVLPCGAVLRLAPGCDLAFVRSLVQALGVQPC